VKRKLAKKIEVNPEIQKHINKFYGYLKRREKRRNDKVDRKRGENKLSG